MELCLLRVVPDRLAQQLGLHTVSHAQQEVARESDEMRSGASIRAASLSPVNLSAQAKWGSARMGSRQKPKKKKKNRISDSSLKPQGPGCQGALASLHSVMKMFPPRAIPTTPWAEPGTGPSPRPRAQARARGRGHGRSRASQALGPGCGTSPHRGQNLSFYTQARSQHRACVARSRATQNLCGTVARHTPFYKIISVRQMLILCGET